METTCSEWVDVPFDAANFRAQGEVPWTVQESNVVTYAYRIEGKTMMLSFKIHNSRLLGSPGELHLGLPAGYTVARGAANPVWIGSKAVREPGYATVHPGHDFVVILRGSEELFPYEDGGFCVFGQLTLEVQ